MNEIEKMYKNAGIKKIELDYPDNFDPFYPEFTAEKQLELIKWLAKKDFTVYNNLGGWYLGTTSFYDEEIGITCKDRVTNINSFEEALAGLINNLWQDMSEEEKQQIKEILE